MSSGRGVTDRLKHVLGSLQASNPPAGTDHGTAVGLGDAGAPEPAESTADLAEGKDLYRPWDRASLLKRASTFKAHLWFGKPLLISSMECARHGWVCVEADVLECQLCRSRLVFEVPQTYSQQQVYDIAKRFQLKLDSGHRKACPWAGGACPKELGRFPPLSNQALKDGFLARVERLRSSLDKVPALADPTLSQLADEVLRARVCNVLGSQDLVTGSSARVEPDSYEQGIRMVALCGWEIDMRPYDVQDASQDVTRASLRNRVSESLSPKDKFQELKFVAKDTSSDKRSSKQATVLRCEFCDATAALWYFEPGAAKAGAGLMDKNGTCLGLGSDSSRPAPSAMATRVPTTPTVDLGGTIAGGPSPVDTVSGAGGPFGMNRSPGTSASPFGLSGCFGAFRAGRGTPMVTGKRAASPRTTNLSKAFDQVSKGQQDGHGLLGKRHNEDTQNDPHKRLHTLKDDHRTDESGSSGTSNARTEDPALKLVGSTTDGVRVFNPLRYHRSACPWINRNTVDSDPTGVTLLATCGWERTVAALLSDESEREVRTNRMEAAQAKFHERQVEHSTKASPTSVRGHARQLVETFLGKH